MIGLLLSTVVAGIVFQMLLGQGQFARMSDAREEVQQSARMALELISAELRAAPPEGIQEAGRNTIRFRQPRTWGHLCQSVTLTTGSTGIWVRFPAATLPNDFLHLQREWGVAIAQVPTAASRYAQFASVGTTTTTNPCATALTAGNAGTQEAGYSVVFGGVNAASVNATVGSAVFLFQEVGYRASGRWIQRLSGYTALAHPVWQEMAGPIAAVDGVEFRYFQHDGTELTMLPLSVADRERVASIRVTVRSESTATSNGVARTQNTSTTLVALRNRT